MSQPDDDNKPHKGVALLLSGFLGPFGADKFYVGATTQGVIQLILSITLFGLLVSVPWSIISSIGIIIAILYNSKNSPIYPDVDWAPQKDIDIYISYFIIFTYIISTIYSYRNASISYSYRNANKYGIYKK